MGGGFAPDPQDAIPNVPDDSQGTPDCYVTPDAAMANLTTRYGLTSDLAYGHLLVASMHLDEEGPFQGVKVAPQQDREWPRTFKYGWPNIIASPSAMLVSTAYPGAWYLDYEGVVPRQIVDWVCLDAWRLTNLPFDRMTTAESVTGASVHYAEGSAGSMLEEMMDRLILPFLIRQGRSQPFSNLMSM